METSGDALIASVFVGFPHAVRPLPPSLAPSPLAPSPLLPPLLNAALSLNACPPRPPSPIAPPPTSLRLVVLTRLTSPLWQDIENAGLSAVVVTDGDEAKAIELRDELLDMAWASRADWVFEHEPLDDAIARAQDMVRCVCSA